MNVAVRLCTIEGCGKRHHIRGFCIAHYARWKRHGDPLAGRVKDGQSEAFFREVVLTWDREDCLIWPHGRYPSGYARMWHDGQSILVQRRVCEEVYGPAPTPEHEAAHSCGRGTDGCINKGHLRWATVAENHNDKIRHGTAQRGEKCGTAKLNVEQVKRIRALQGKMKQADVGEMFGVSQFAVWAIQSRRSWAWLK